jgi:Right handed beta helix region
MICMQPDIIGGSSMRMISGAAVATALTLVIYASPAAAQALTFVSATGNDANPCSVQAQPCKTLQRAVNVTLAGGEIRLLSSLPGAFNATVAKSLTINGDGDTMIGTITVNGASAIVTLHALGLSGRSSLTTGIRIASAKAVHIEGCTVERYTGNGISLEPDASTKLFVSDSVSRDNGGQGLSIMSPTTATLTVDNSRFENNAKTGLDFQGGQGSVSDSTLSGNTLYGIGVSGGGLDVTGTTTAANRIGIAMFGGVLTLQSSIARGNRDYGLYLDGAGMTARVSKSSLTLNAVGTYNSAGGTILTLGDNVISGNTTQNVFGSLTTLAPL